jgi:hypothetical protein
MIVVQRTAEYGWFESKRISPGPYFGLGAYNKAASPEFKCFIKYGYC